MDWYVEKLNSATLASGAFAGYKVNTDVADWAFAPG